MKKIFSTVLVLLLAFSLVACGGGASSAPASTAAPASSGAASEAAPVESGEPLVVATVVKAIGSNWFDSMDWEGSAWAEENNAEHHYIGPTSMDSAAQLQCVEDAIALQPDILTVVPIAADAVDALLKQARFLFFNPVYDPAEDGAVVVLVGLSPCALVVVKLHNAGIRKGFAVQFHEPVVVRFAHLHELRIGFFIGFRLCRWLDFWLHRKFHLFRLRGLRCRLCGL